MRRIEPLRGVRGVPLAQVSALALKHFHEEPPVLGEDDEALSSLFSTAWEDGLVAIGLLAAAGLGDPEGALDLAMDWADRTDDVETADALGTLIIGPAALALGRPLEGLGTATHPREETRRAAIVGGLALTPWIITGVAASPLRAKLGTKALRFVEAPRTEALRSLLAAHFRDEAPPVRKAVRRVLTEWHNHDPEAAADWVLNVPGGAAKMLREVALPQPKTRPRRRR